MLSTPPCFTIDVKELVEVREGCEWKVSITINYRNDCETKLHTLKLAQQIDEDLRWFVNEFAFKSPFYDSRACQARQQIRDYARNLHQTICNQIQPPPLGTPVLINIEAASTTSRFHSIEMGVFTHGPMGGRCDCFPASSPRQT